MSLSFCDIPDWTVKKLPVPWSQELSAAFEIPFEWGKKDIPPLSIGVLSLMETVGCMFLQSPANFNLAHDILRPAYIAIHREKCVKDCIEHRAFYEAMPEEFSEDDLSTWSPLDFKCAEFFDLEKDMFSEEKIIGLWSFFNISFSGYATMHGGGSGECLEWRFGVDSISNYIKVLSEKLNEPLFNIMWRVPVALGSHIIAKTAQAESTDIKVYRPYDNEHIDRLREYGIKTELSGELLFWQKMHPLDYDLSAIQIGKNESLPIKYAELRKHVESLTPEERKARADEIFQKERVE